MSKSKWYKQGFADFSDGICDPPWYKGNPSHTNYMEGWKEAALEEEREEFLERQAEREVYGDDA